LEGFVEARLKKREDGGQYLALYFSGPIRSAGGTPQAITILVADYLRRKHNIDVYDPTEDEIKRYCVEVNDYSSRVAKKQYLPNPEEVTFLVKHIPVEINGDPTEVYEVSQFKRLPRVETTRIRGGMCLVLTEGPALKSKKVWRNLKNWAKEFGLEEWKWLDEFTKLKDRIQSAQKSGEKSEEKGIKPDFYYLSDMVAGRPVFGYPKRRGGFRLRYGRSRLTGDGSWAVSPLTMIVLDNYLATGTQLKVEHPGKGTALTVCDSIDGPTVLLEDGTVLRVETEEQAREVKSKVKKILFIGDILISHGDFVEQGFRLIPPGYCEEWWALELKKQNPSEPEIIKLLENPIKAKVAPQEAIRISEKYKIPLHPRWTYHWIEASPDDLLKLKSNIQNPALEIKPILEAIGCPHSVKGNEIILDADNQFILNYILKTEFKISNEANALEVLQNNLPVKIRDKSGMTIGARMGRPEKSKLRKMKGSPHALFPVGTEGGRLRSFLTVRLIIEPYA
ncbi:MAG: DNA polymerase II large subunit, partial [Planctomycetota bacterium]